MAVKDDSGDEKTKVKDDESAAEKDNCMRWGRGQGNGYGEGYQ